VLSGELAPRREGAPKSGSLTFDLDAAAKVLGSEDRGIVHVEHSTGACARSLHFDFVGFHPADSGKDERPWDGSSALEWAFVQDIHAEHGEEAPCLETISLVTRWTPEGSGRADFKIAGGELRFWSILGAQCWDEQFKEVWSKPTRVFREPERGDASLCAFPDRAESERIEVPQPVCE